MNTKVTWYELWDPRGQSASYWAKPHRFGTEEAAYEAAAATLARHEFHSYNLPNAEVVGQVVTSTSDNVEVRCRNDLKTVVRCDGYVEAKVPIEWRAIRVTSTHQAIVGPDGRSYTRTDTETAEIQPWTAWMQPKRDDYGHKFIEPEVVMLRLYVDRKDMVFVGRPEMTDTEAVDVE